MCCIFSEHLFSRTPLDGCFEKFLSDFSNYIFQYIEHNYIDLEDLYQLWIASIIRWKESFYPIQDGPFLGLLMNGGGKKSPLPKICQTYPAMMKLGTVIPYLKKIEYIYIYIYTYIYIYIYKSHDTPLEFCWHQYFFTRIFCNIKKYRYSLILIHNFQSF